MEQVICDDYLLHFFLSSALYRPSGGKDKKSRGESLKFLALLSSLNRDCERKIKEDQLLWKELSFLFWPHLEKLKGFAAKNWRTFLKRRIVVVGIDGGQNQENIENCLSWEFKCPIS